MPTPPIGHKPPLTEENTTSSAHNPPDDRFEGLRMRILNERHREQEKALASIGRLEGEEFEAKVRSKLHKIEHTAEENKTRDEWLDRMLKLPFKKVDREELEQKGRTELIEQFMDKLESVSNRIDMPSDTKQSAMEILRLYIERGESNEGSSPFTGPPGNRRTTWTKEEWGDRPYVYLGGGSRDMNEMDPMDPMDPMDLMDLMDPMD